MRTASAAGSDEDEGRGDLVRNAVHSRERLERDCRRDVPRTEADDTDDRFSALDREPAEVGVVCQDHTTESASPPQDLDVGSAGQVLLVNGSNVPPETGESRDDLRSDILVSEERKVERPAHAGILTSQTTSFLRALAAYSSAARSPSAGKWGYARRTSSGDAPLARSSRTCSTLIRVPRMHGLRSSSG
jgi:hypothetical protein